MNTGEKRVLIYLNKAEAKGEGKLLFMWLEVEIFVFNASTCSISHWYYTDNYAVCCRQITSSAWDLIKIWHSMCFRNQMSTWHTIKCKLKLDLRVHLNMINVIREKRKGILIDLPRVKWI